MHRLFVWHRVGGGGSKAEGARLLIADQSIHEAFMMVVVVGVLGCIGWQQKIVGAQPVSLCVRVGKYARLQELVI